MAVAGCRWGWQKSGKGQEFKMGAVRSQIRGKGQLEARWDNKGQIRCCYWG